MTDVEERSTEAAQAGRRPPLRDLTARQQRRLVAAGLLRALVSATVLVVLYYVVPFDSGFGAGAVTVLVVALLGVALIVVWQTRRILKADYPAIAGVQALALIIPLFLLLFASAYYLMNRALPASFGQHLSRTDSLYFTVTTFSTVGYGDITAKAQGARIVVIFQMLGDLVVLGFGVRVIIGAVQMTRERLHTSVAGSPAESAGAIPGGEGQRELPATEGQAPGPE